MKDITVCQEEVVMKRKAVLAGLCASLAVVCALGIVMTQTRVDNRERGNEVNEYHVSDVAADTVINYGGLDNRQIEGNIKTITVIDSDCTVHTYSSDMVENKGDLEPAQWEGKTDFEPGTQFGRTNREHTYMPPEPDEGQQ